MTIERLTFLALAERVLREEGHPLTVQDIWDIAQEKGYDNLTGTRGKTPWLSIGAQIYVDIRDNEDSIFIKIDSKPRKFFLKELVSPDELEKFEEEEKKSIEKPRRTKYTERDLHPLLTYYAYYYMNAYTKTIYHEKTRKKSYAQWLHPDLVGVDVPTEMSRKSKKRVISDWNPNVLDFGQQVGEGLKLIKLYSFELKKELNFQNLRESFFQAVSNSSWANKGFLVASDVQKDNEFRAELGRLSTSFGIGVIELNVEDPDDSQEIFPAVFREELDWPFINKLAQDNPDFEEFIIRITKDLSTKEVRRDRYDQIKSKENLIELIKK